MKNAYFTSLLLLFSTFVLAQDVTLELFKSGFNSPLYLLHANDDRLFVVEKDGKIKIIQADGTINTTPFLDISAQISNQGEQGLLGMAFHPNYASNGYFYVNYTDNDGDTQISRFSVDPTNPDVANANSEFHILGYAQPFTNHNGGNILFGPDGYLYISSGDGGGSGDPNNRSQDLNTLLGKLLRIDVDNPSGGNNYGIPVDNPFVGDPNAMPEIFAYGLRNPWRFSIDLTENELWIADVGQGNLEEINRTPLANSGANYGWSCYEGSQPFNPNGCPPQSDMEFPFAEYSHTNGNCSISGGFVYRGSTYSDIAGLYFFADFCSGMIGSVDNSGNLVDYGNFSGNWVSFGEDIHKELYIVDISGGDIYKIKGDQLVGNEDFSMENSLSILPIPASESITFSLKNGLLDSIELYDVNGRLIRSVENISNSKKTISVTDLAAGMYFGEITSKKGTRTVKNLIVGP